MLQGPVANPNEVVSLLSKHVGMDVTFDSLGGKVSTVDPADTAFWYRKALADVQIYSPATAGTRDAKATAIGEVAVGLAKLGIQGGYVNYIDPALPDWANAYYGDNLPRLRQVAKTYDPNKVFAFAQSVQAT
jgi:hypothetical protein